MVNDPITKPSEFLIAAKAKFGPGMVRWTRFFMERKGIAGQNYCSLGAMRAIEQLGTADSNVEYRASCYLRSAMGNSIPQFNDWGLRLDDCVACFPGWIKFMWLMLTRYHPGSWLLRKRQVQKAWCQAIKMAVTDELAAEQAKEPK